MVLTDYAILSTKNDVILYYQMNALNGTERTSLGKFCVINFGKDFSESLTSFCNN